MTTALDVIKRSMRLLGVYSIGEEPSAEESQDCLTALNALMGTLSNSAMVYVKTLDSISLTAGQSSVTVGPTGTTVTTRPMEVLGDSYVLIGTVSYPLSVLTLQQYNDIGVKTIQGIPAGVWPKMDMPDITLTFWPVPDQAMTLKLWSDKLISSFSGLTTIVSLPPGYDDALAYLLAETIAPEFQVEPPPAVMRGAVRARSMLKRANYEVPQLDMPAAALGRPAFVDIRQL